MTTRKELQTGMIDIREHNTYEQATNASYAESSNTGGWTFPVVIFRQGTRIFLSGAFPIGFVESRLFSRSGEKGAGIKSAFASMNRPLEPGHTKNIANYIQENISGRYILPPLTLNVQEKVSLHTIKSGNTFKAGYLVIPSGVNLAITDGQHRVKGIIQALDRLALLDPESSSRLRADSVSVMITCEHELKQIHQDFADCSKTKALPPSLLSLFDTRNPANRIVFELEQSCPLFKGRIDTTSKTLSTKSVYLFLANQIRQMIKHLLTRTNPSDDDFERIAKEQLKDDGSYNNYLKRYIEYINYFTKTIPVLKQISQIPSNLPQKGLIPKLRKEGWVCLTATGLNLLGCIGHDLLTHGIREWRSVVDKFAEVDWKRTGQIWQGNIIQDGKLITQSSPLRKAVESLKKEIKFQIQ